MRGADDMTPQVDAFFYGLFMDVGVLQQLGVKPTDPRPAVVADFALRIGQRATLVPMIGSRCYGMIFALTQSELDQLYGGPGLEHYHPEQIVASLLSGNTCPALCYNLPEAPAASDRNPQYAERLQAVLSKLGFPSEYIESIA